MGLGLRLLPLKNVFTDSMVQLKGADAYFFTRQAEDIRNGGLPLVDPLLCYDQGFVYDRGAALYPYILAGMGNFMPLDVATAISSPLFAVIFFVIMFFLLKELFPNNQRAIISGLVVACWTGIQFISRSYLGFGDRHVVENVLLVGGLTLLIKAWHKESWKWGLASGVVFMGYAFVWSQSSLILGIVGLGLVIKYLTQKESSKNFTIINSLALGLPIIVGIAFGNLQQIGVSGAFVLIFIALSIVEKKFNKKQHRLAVSLGVGLLAIAAVYFLANPLWSKLLASIWGFIGNPSNGPVVSEAQPMYVIYNSIDFLPPNAVTLQLIIFTLAVLGFWNMIVKKHYMMAFMGIVLALLSVWRIRTEYYFVIFAAIGVAYLVAETKRGMWLIVGLSSAFVFIYGLVWWQDLSQQNSSLAFTNADYQMAEWMRVNTDNAGVALAGNYADGIKPSYGVLADWQLGYLYTFTAKKPFVAEPNFCNYDIPTQFFMLNNEQEAYDLLKSRKIKYVVVKAMDLNKYFYYLSQQNKKDDFKMVTGKVQGKQYTFINQDYYTRMASRLYNFDGNAYVPSEIYTIDTDKNLNNFTNYEAAKATGATTFYGVEVNKASVPLEQLKHFKLLQKFVDFQGGVKLFEVVD